MAVKIFGTQTVEDVNNTEDVNRAFETLAKVIDTKLTQLEATQLIQQELKSPYPVGAYYEQFAARLTNDFKDAFPEHEYPENIWNGTKWKLMYDRQDDPDGYAPDVEVRYGASTRNRRNLIQQDAAQVTYGVNGRCLRKTRQQAGLFYDQYQNDKDDIKYKTKQDLEEYGGHLIAIASALGLQIVGASVQAGALLAELAAWAAMFTALSAFYTAEGMALVTMIGANAAFISPLSDTAFSAIIPPSPLGMQDQIAMRKWKQEQMPHMPPDPTSNIHFIPANSVDYKSVIDCGGAKAVASGLNLITTQLLLISYIVNLLAMEGVFIHFVWLLNNPGGSKKVLMDGFNSNLSVPGDAVSNHTREIRCLVWRRLK